jgi:sugar lactone lactonase YvrE
LVTGVQVGPAFAVSLTSATPQSITTIAGNGFTGASGDGGPAVNAELNGPNGVALDLSGDLYISDGANNRIRKVVNPTAIHTDTITTIAGNGMSGFEGDGGPAGAAELNKPSGIAIDSAGDLFIADSGNNRVREVPASGNIETFAGDGACGPGAPLGDGLPAVQASLCHPSGVAVDGSRVYISDSGHHVVRVVDSAGIIRTFAGAGTSGRANDGDKNGRDPPKISLDFPTGLAVDAAHDVFIADSGASQVLEARPNGTLQTFAGTGKPGFKGDGRPATKARLNGPTGVGVDLMGDVYIADTFNNRLREVNGSGVISTVAGTGQFGFSGDGGSATQADLGLPTGSVAVSSSAIYFSDTANQRVRGVFTGPPPVLPETSWAIVLPLAAIAVVGAGYVLMRRRHRVHDHP